jgi:hypothetical protein
MAVTNIAPDPGDVSLRREDLTVLQVERRPREATTRIEMAWCRRERHRRGAIRQTKDVNA